MNPPPWRVTWASRAAEQEWRRVEEAHPPEARAAKVQLERDPLASVTLVGPVPRVRFGAKELPQRLVWLNENIAVNYAVDLRSGLVWILRVRRFPGGTFV